MAVRPALPGDLERVREIAIAAGERFRSVDDPRISARADDVPYEVDDLAAARAAGRLLVADDDRGVVVGFLLVEEVDGHAHVAEVSVHPDHQRRGHASALLAAVDGPVTLTTFADVAWNRPFYERRGFRVLAPDELTAGLRELVEREAALGLEPALRVVMVRATS